ncbi:MAG: carboxypeptidase-like regulatory domain-containing protein [Bacteroidaceae bacterium]|nr:carboxypeptidase-like regulatory domain-containing protein [Bacteroidaceae bacterium]
MRNIHFNFSLKNNDIWRVYIHIFTIFALLMVCSSSHAQVTGVVVDARTKQPIEFVHVYYPQEKTSELSDLDGRFSIKENDEWNELTFSSVGYITQSVKLKAGKKKNLVVRLIPATKVLKDVTITAKRKKYKKENNPAVQLMQKVIAHKKNSNLHEKDFFKYTKYEKMVFSADEVSDKVFEEDKMKRFSFLMDHVETSPETGKLVLPLTIDETISEHIYRKNPKSEKTIINAQSSKGISQLVNTGEILTTTLKDVFTDIDIYQNECRLLQSFFRSPIADNAISFYRYYIQDTTYINKDKVIEVSFIPNNQQDFGFSGTMYILADSTYQLRRVEFSIPKQSAVNFVENMLIQQEFELLPTGERVVVTNDMLIEIEVASFLHKLQVKRVIRNKDFSFDEIPDDRFKKIKGNIITSNDAGTKDEKYWNQHRDVELTQSEKKIGSFIKKITQVKGFKYAMFAFRALVENFIETGDSTENYVDLGPVNTVISGNHYDSWRVRLSALTNANLNKHLFANGYIAYGSATNNIYGRAQLTYSFNKPSYLPREFPTHCISISYWNDIVSPFDKFIQTDKDNLFTALKTNKVDQFNHTKEFKLSYTHEYVQGIKISADYTHARNKAVDELFYQPLNGDILPVQDKSLWLKGITTSEFKFGFSYEPGATYFNTKQKRNRMNRDAPIYSISHTIGLNNFIGGDYNYNVTEVGLLKRFWMPGSWGSMDIDLKAGIQWNKVPFPLLIHPAANQSYVLQKSTFSLINNLEFLNDKYVSFMYQWDINGKIFNRIPLFKRLKWRELIGVNVLWGSLSNKNNPAHSNYTDADLFYFPGHFRNDGTYECNTSLMKKDLPYIEGRFAIHNIFKFLHLEYVRRFTYLDNPDIHKWGLRCKLEITF